MKSTLEFELPGDRTEFQLAVNGHKTALIIWNILQHLRNMIKYRTESEELDISTLEIVRNSVHTIMDDHNISEEDIS